ncbi:MAG: hypothetical protein AVDCRST_MAG67-3883 [uncultured Solirubrobacteraceae bacterium]|uniref:Uncharacterized protein n=1 Tax=uncultured Solirubrobacteraceae bacterium TaxID=1162706 RepID=A0A6J4TH23_9ACTN|nr:MAG: hypothetical protein AVDCRST_MAG67-3883 [uncultured Solirubrobacteraceae bacterium]
MDRRDVTRVHGIPATTAARGLLEIAPHQLIHRLRAAGAPYTDAQP